MRLIYKIMLSLAFPLIVTLGLWGWLSYVTMEKKIHADADLILKDYSDDIIMRILAGKRLPERFNGVYNTYFIEDITPEQAASYPAVEYTEAEVGLRDMEEFASSRVRKQVFVDADGTYRRLTVSLPTFEQEVLIEHVLRWTALLFVALLATLMIIGAIVIHHNMRPLYRLLAWIDRYEPGNTPEALPSDTDVHEFRKLASVVESAVLRFERQYEEKKIFIGNASHELQTPLAVCSNRLEMILGRQDLSDEVAAELVKVHRSLGSLIKLNKTLLLLSKIENGQFPQVDFVDIGPILRDSLSLHREMYEYKDLVTDFKEEGAFAVKIDEQMASVLVGNLLKNAFLYTPKGGKIEVRVSHDGFTVSNSAEKPLDAAKVFRRFYQPDGRREGSTGLGLALVYSVCLSNSMNVRYDCVDGMHVFSVNLNKSK